MVDASVETDEIQCYADRGDQSTGATPDETIRLCVELRKERATSARLAAEINRIRPYLIDEGDRQMILLALSHLSIKFPGWLYCHQEIAKRLGGSEMFAEFRKHREDERREEKGPA